MQSKEDCATLSLISRTLLSLEFIRVTRYGIAASAGSLRQAHDLPFPLQEACIAMISAPRLHPPHPGFNYDHHAAAIVF